MVRKGNLAVFESTNISEIREVTPTKIGVHALTSTPTCMNFFSQFYLIQFFSLPWTIVHGQGNLVVFESSNISEIGEVTPTKISVHAFDINPYLHEFFEPILFD